MIFKERPYISPLYDKTTVTLTLDKKYTKEVCDIFDNLTIDADYEIVIREKRQKRSMDANGYAWHLIGKLAAYQKISPVEVYREQIRNLPTYEMVCIQNEAVEAMRNKWSSNGIGWMVVEMPSKIEGCTNLMLFYGSSTFNSKEMSQLIDNLVTECKIAHIETRTPEEIEKLKSLWGKK